MYYYLYLAYKSKVSKYIDAKGVLKLKQGVEERLFYEEQFFSN